MINNPRVDHIIPDSSVGKSGGFTYIMAKGLANNGTYRFVIIIEDMIHFYRVRGCIVSLKLLLYTWLLLVVFVLFNTTLTFPGNAAFVMEMSFDVNIIT